MKVFFPRFPWRVKRTTVIYICQDELPAVVLCGILSEGRQGAPEKKNGVGGSIFVRIATADLYENGNGVLSLYCNLFVKHLTSSALNQFDNSVNEENFS